MKDLTAVITTFNRPKSLLKLIKSIRKYYNDLPIIVVDNGNEVNNKIRTKGVSYYKVPFDSGLSYSRNFDISKVKTKYIVLLDDDFEFTSNTKVDNLLKIAKENDFDIVGGSVEGLSYNGILELDGNILTYIKGDRGIINGYHLCDMVLNFFVGKVESIKKNNCCDE
jgi:beta-1,4-N-acetylgalactosaminyltransferase 2